MDSELERAIKEYDVAITALKKHPSSAQVLQVLIARDRVHSVLEGLTTLATALPPIETLDKLSQLDQTLRTKASMISPYTNSADWRASFHPNEKAWWWFLEAPKTQWSDRFDWLWSGVSVTCLTISLGLIGDIAPRFLTGTPDSFGAFTVSAQSVLTLLVAGGALTKSGQESLTRLLKVLNIPQTYWSELGAIASGLVVCGLFSFRQSLPQIATTVYTNPGIESRKQGDWSTAQAQFNRAIKLNADDAQAHFQLGVLDEDLQMADQARLQYQLAIQGGVLGATNNLARLDILQKDYSGAVSLLLKALDPDQKQPLDLKTKYIILKNLGWARLMQKNYPDAEAKLLEAINLQSRLKLEKYDIADPNCLLAQVMEAEGHQTGVLKRWKICNQYANITIPEQDEWAAIAQKRLIPRETHK